MTALATSEDVEARWRTLTSDEEAIADTLLDDASSMIRDEWGDVDSRISTGSLSSDSVVRVVATMVKRAMMNGGTEGISAQTQTAGPFSVNNQFSNPNGSLYLTDAERRLFGGFGRSKVGWLA